MNLKFHIKMIVLPLYSLFKVLMDKGSRKEIQLAFRKIDEKKFDNFQSIYAHQHSMTLFNFLNKFVLLSSVVQVKRYLERNVSVSDTVIWEAIRLHQGPVLFVTPHYGPFALGCLKAILDFGEHKKVNAFYDPPSKNPTTVIYKEILSKLGTGFEPIFNNKRGVIKALKALKRNEIVAMMPDVYETNPQSMAVPFFGHLTTAMAGTAFLAIKSNAMLVQAYCEVNKNGSIHIVLELPPVPKESSSTDKNIYQLTAQIFLSMEKQIKRQPQHWIYLRKLLTRLDFSLEEVSQEESFLAMLNTLSKSVGISSMDIDLLIKYFSTVKEIK